MHVRRVSEANGGGFEATIVETPPDSGFEASHHSGDAAGARAHVEKRQTSAQLERLERARVDRRRREVHDAPRARLGSEGPVGVALLIVLSTDAVHPAVNRGEGRLDRGTGERARFLQPLHQLGVRVGGALPRTLELLKELKQRLPPDMGLLCFW